MTHTALFLPGKSNDFKELPLSPPEPVYYYEMSGDSIESSDDEELLRESELQRELAQKLAQELIEKLRREDDFKRS